MAITIRIRRGLKADLPELAVGEFGYCLDTKELYIGGQTGNEKVNVHNLDEIADGTERKLTDFLTKLEATATYADKEHSHSWESILLKPEEFPPSSHDHDERYDTRVQSDVKLALKAEKNHNHDEVYAKKAHDHDDKYYTESEVDLKLDAKADSTHNHDTTYAKKSHSHEIAEVEGLQAELDSKASATHSHSYNDLDDKPTIPVVPDIELNDSTETSGKYISKIEVDGTNKHKLNITKKELPQGFSGNYNDLTNKPTIPTPPTKVSELVNDKNYVDENFVNSKLTAVYKFKGSVANYTALPATDLVVGDVYDVKDTGMNYAWNGTDWDALGSFVDLSDYYSKDETFSQEQVSQLLDSKVDKVSGKGLSSNDYTTIEKNKLAGIEAGAEVNPTASEVKILYESNADTNAFTDLEKANVEKIPGIEGDIIDLQSNKADKTELFSGSYSDLTNKPAIYTKTEIDAMIGDIETLLGGI